MSYTEGYHVDKSQLHTLVGYEICGPKPKLKDVGRLIQAFNDQCGPFYSLFVQRYTENCRALDYKLFLMRSVSCFSEEESPLTREEYAKYCGFVKGFAAACMS
jgi:hypothetical protein